MPFEITGTFPSIYDYSVQDWKDCEDCPDHDHLIAKVKLPFLEET